MSESRNLVALVETFKSRGTALSVDFVTADIVGVTYAMMPGAHPSDAGCIVAIWQDQDQIPWEDTPLAVQSIGSQQSGSVSFDRLSVQDNNYIIGLAVGPLQEDSQKNRNVAAQAFIPNATDPPQLASDNLVLTFVGTTSLTVQFNCLPGYRAATDKAWLGLWRGAAASYTLAPDVGAVPIKLDSNFGTAAFNNISIGVGLTYTVGLFTTGWATDPAARNQNSLACSLTFTQGK